MSNKAALLIVHSLPLFGGILLSYLFWETNWLLLAIYLVLSAVMIATGKDRKTEIWIIIYGMIAGFLIETVGTHISGYQSFTKPQIFSIPYWLIVVWGYGFVLMKRISLIIATDTPWTKISNK